MALKAIKLTETGDIEQDTLSKPTYLYGQDAVDQLVRNAFGIWLNEWFRDPTRGVDWLNIFKKKYNRNEIIQILTTALLKITYITEVTDIFILVDDAERTVTITYSVIADGEAVTGAVIV